MRVTVLGQALMAVLPTPLVQALLAAGEAVIGDVDELNRLDGYAGDGDLGITMAQAAQAMKRVLEDMGERARPNCCPPAGPQ